MIKMKLLGLTFLLVSSLQISLGDNSTNTTEPTILSEKNDEDFLNITGGVRGNLNIVVMLAIHSSTSNLYYPKCGPIQDQAGMQRVEAALWALDRINTRVFNDWNFKLGLEIKDTCGSYVYAFQQGLSIWSDVNNKKDLTIVGTVGPPTSAEIKITHEWLNQSNVVQVGFSATSPRMTEKKVPEFPAFARLVPSDTFLVQAIMDLIINYFNWNCVNFIATAGVYGSDALKEFQHLANYRNICIYSKEIIYDDSNHTDLENIIHNSTQFNQAIVCFCEGRTLRSLFNVSKTLNKTKDIIFILSEGWAEFDTENITKEFKEELLRSIMINPSPQLTVPTDDFKMWYSNMTKRSPTMNPWIEEFYNHKFSCTLNDTGPNHLKKCTKKEKGNPMNDSHPDPKLPLIVGSIYAVANAVKDYIMKNQTCGKNCTYSQYKHLPNFTTHFMKFIKNYSIEFEDNKLQLDSNGDPSISSYEILICNETHGTLTFSQVGVWTNDTTSKAYAFGNNTYDNALRKYKQQIKNECQIQCSTGQMRVWSNCCWKCEKCGVYSISNGNTTYCTQCPECLKPDAEKKQCIDKDINRIPLFGENGIGGMLCVFISSVGATLTIFTAIVFYIKRRTPIVKLASTHLSFIIFGGMLLAYSCTIFGLMIPTFITCTLLKFIPSISLTMIYGPLLMKTNRIARALSATKKRVPKLKIKYLSATFLISVSCMFIVVNLLLCTGQYVTFFDENKWNNKSGFFECILIEEKIKVFCPAESLASFNIRHFINVFLLSYCTVYAFSTRNLPENFKETKWIYLSCGATAAAWIVFIIIFYDCQTNETWKTKAISLNMVLSSSAFITLVFMYFPKLYIVLLHPKRNHRAFFSTMTEGRCWYGNTESRIAADFSSVNMDSAAVVKPRKDRIENKKKDRKNSLKDKTKKRGKK